MMVATQRQNSLNGPLSRDIFGDKTALTMFFGFLELFIMIKEEDCENPATVFLWTHPDSVLA